jgi:hypothetical protein
MRRPQTASEPPDAVAAQTAFSPGPEAGMEVLSALPLNSLGHHLLAQDHE